MDQLKNPEVNISVLVADIVVAAPVKKKELKKGNADSKTKQKSTIPSIRKSTKSNVSKLASSLARLSILIHPKKESWGSPKSIKSTMELPKKKLTTPMHHPKKESCGTPKSRMSENKKPALKLLHMSINSDANLVKKDSSQPPQRTTQMGKVFTPVGMVIFIRDSFASSPAPSRLQASVSSARPISKTCHTETKRSRVALEKGFDKIRKMDQKLQSPSTGWMKSSFLSPSPIKFSSFNFRSEERAAKSREFLQKRMEKTAEKMQPADKAKEDPLRALGESVSFGKYMLESLAWENWSSFSHNPYLEEVEKYIKPRSVAQLIAYFEAHCKKTGAKKQVDLDQSNSCSSIDKETLVKETPDVALPPNVVVNSCDFCIDTMELQHGEAIVVEMGAPMDQLNVDECSSEIKIKENQSSDAVETNIVVAALERKEPVLVENQLKKVNVNSKSKQKSTISSIRKSSKSNVPKLSSSLARLSTPIRPKKESCGTPRSISSAMELLEKKLTTPMHYPIKEGFGTPNSRMYQNKKPAPMLWTFLNLPKEQLEWVKCSVI